MNTIGDRIRKRRIELDMSQQLLAEKIGYKDRSSINKIEKDGRNLTQKKIKAIADALLTTPDYIMGWDEEDTISEKKKTLISLVDSLSEEQADILLNLIKQILQK